MFADLHALAKDVRTVTLMPKMRASGSRLDTLHRLLKSSKTRLVIATVRLRAVLQLNARTVTIRLSRSISDHLSVIISPLLNAQSNASLMMPAKCSRFGSASMLLAILILHRGLILSRACFHPLRILTNLRN